MVTSASVAVGALVQVVFFVGSSVFSASTHADVTSSTRSPKSSWVQAISGVRKELYLGVAVYKVLHSAKILFFLLLKGVIVRFGLRFKVFEGAQVNVIPKHIIIYLQMVGTR